MIDPKRGPDFSPSRLMSLVAIVALAIIAYRVFGHHLSFESLRQNHEALEGFRDAHYLWAVATFCSVYVAIVALSVPGGAVASLAGGFLFGLFPGMLYSVVAATLGATLIFLVARYGLGAALSRRMEASHGIAHQVREELMMNEFSFLFVMRLIPAIPFFVANIIPALVGVHIWRFVVTTFFGIMPGTLAFTWLGAGLGEVFSRGQTPDFAIVFKPFFLGPVLALCVAALIPVVVRHLRKPRKES